SRRRFFHEPRGRRSEEGDPVAGVLRWGAGRRRVVAIRPSGTGHSWAWGSGRRGIETAPEVEVVCGRVVRDCARKTKLYEAPPVFHGEQATTACRYFTGSRQPQLAGSNCSCADGPLS